MGLHPRTNKVDGPNFVNVSFLLPYTICFCKVKIFVRLQMYLKQLGVNPWKFLSYLQLVDLSKSTDIET